MDSKLVKQKQVTTCLDGSRNSRMHCDDATQNGIRRFAQAFDQVNSDDYERRGNLMWERDNFIRGVIQDKTGREVNVRYALGWNDLGSVAVEGKCMFVYPYLDHTKWIATTYRSAVVESPTCLELTVLADEAIHVSEDYHHCFLEDFSPIGTNHEGIPIYELYFGS